MTYFSTNGVVELFIKLKSIHFHDWQKVLSFEWQQIKLGLFTFYTFKLQETLRVICERVPSNTTKLNRPDSNKKLVFLELGSLPTVRGKIPFEGKKNEQRRGES